MSDADYPTHESWCDTQNNISTMCNCIVSGYIDQIEELKAELTRLREREAKLIEDSQAEAEDKNEMWNQMEKLVEALKWYVEEAYSLSEGTVIAAKNGLCEYASGNTAREALAEWEKKQNETGG